MKKLILPITLSIFTLAVGFLLGGLRAGRIATEQAYHSDLNFFIAIDRHLEKNEIEKAKETSAQAIRGALSVLDTFESDARSPLVFVLPTSETLLDSETKASLRSQAELAISKEVAQMGSIQAR